MLPTYSLILDTGCFVLIWLVQLVIYPSFNFYSPSDLKKWHSKYTITISFVVLPLMLGQLIVSGLDTFQTFSALSIIKLGLIAIIWIMTFLIFVPLHKNIDNKNTTGILVNELVKKNWLRTILWSSVFAIALIQNIIP